MSWLPWVGQKAKQMGGRMAQGVGQAAGMPGFRPTGPYGAQHQQFDIANRRLQGDARRQRQTQQKQARQKQLKQLGQDRPWLKTYGKSGAKTQLGGFLNNNAQGVMASKRGGRPGAKGGGYEVEGSKINWSAIAAYQGMTPQQQRQLAMTSPHLVPQVNGRYIGAGGDILNQGKGLMSPQAAAASFGKYGPRNTAEMQQYSQMVGMGGGQPGQQGMQGQGQGLGRAGGGGFPGGGFGNQVNQLKGQLFGQGGQNALHQQNMASGAGAAQMRQRAAASGRTENLGGQIAQFQGAQEQGRQNALQQNQFQQVSMALQAMGIQADLAAKLAEAAALSGIQSPSQIMGA